MMFRPFFFWCCVTLAFGVGFGFGQQNGRETGIIEIWKDYDVDWRNGIGDYRQLRIEAWAKDGGYESRGIGSDPGDECPTCEGQGFINVYKAWEHK